MNALGWAVAGFLAGWIFGVWASYRKIRQDRKTRERRLGKRFFDLLQKADVITVTVTEEGETKVEFDQEGLDELLGNKPTEH